MTNEQMTAGRFLRWHKGRHTMQITAEHAITQF